MVDDDDIMIDADDTLCSMSVLELEFGYMDECESRLCLNNGTCVDLLRGRS